VLHQTSLSAEFADGGVLPHGRECRLTITTLAVFAIISGALTAMPSLAAWKTHPGDPAGQHHENPAYFNHGNPYASFRHSRGGTVITPSAGSRHIIPLQPALQGS
jgi:hypothetical protein